MGLWSVGFGIVVQPTCQMFKCCFERLSVSDIDKTTIRSHNTCISKIVNVNYTIINQYGCTVLTITLPDKEMGHCHQTG